jgi:hypothetical protein
MSGQVGRPLAAHQILGLNVEMFDRGLPMILQLFLVLENLTIEHVNKFINGSVHILVSGFREEVLALYMNVGLDVLALLLHLEDDADINDVVKVSADTSKLVVKVLTDGGGHFEMLACNAEIHNYAPSVS